MARILEALNPFDVQQRIDERKQRAAITEGVKQDNLAKEIANQDSYMKLAAKLKLGSAYDNAARLENTKNSVNLKMLSSYEKQLSPEVLDRFGKSKLIKEMADADLQAFNSERSREYAVVGPMIEQGVTTFNRPQFLQQIERQLGREAASKWENTDIKDYSKAAQVLQGQAAYSQTLIAEKSLTELKSQQALTKVDREAAYAIDRINQQRAWDLAMMALKDRAAATKTTQQVNNDVATTLDTLGKWAPDSQLTEQAASMFEVSMPNLDIDEGFSRLGSAQVQYANIISNETAKANQQAKNAGKIVEDWDTYADNWETAKGLAIAGISDNGEDFYRVDLAGKNIAEVIMRNPYELVPEPNRKAMQEFASINSTARQAYQRNIVESDPGIAKLANSNPDWFEKYTDVMIWSDPVARGLTNAPETQMGNSGMSPGLIFRKAPPQEKIPGTNINMPGI